MTDQPVRLTAAEGVATIAIDRPAARNALDTATKEALLAALRAVTDDATVRCVVLTGTGRRAFSAGQDLKEHQALLASGDIARLWSTVPKHYNPIALALHELDKPVVAGVNGVAAGAGAALVFLADYRLLASSAAIDTAFSRIGLSCDTGTSWTLPRLVGPTRALELLLRPRTIPSDEALALGIATEVVPDTDFPSRLSELAATLAAGPTLAYASIRRSVAYSATHTLAESLEFEGEQMRRTGASQDHQAAVDAFLAKRSPEFTGR
ncbi:MAG TPA: enoyl-CoA hydratase-related protein [Propionibacteriaceae bacterium]|nr:enoyl-CoA hydratase-related protein [Propionibacteriaceae bacterium]